MNCLIPQYFKITLEQDSLGYGHNPKPQECLVNIVPEAGGDPLEASKEEGEVDIVEIDGEIYQKVRIEGEPHPFLMNIKGEIFNLDGQMMGQAHDNLQETWGQKNAIIREYTQTLGEKGLIPLIGKRE